ncbi:uncharacterized protein BDFB_010844, partial [Asbolus verrucosus]
VQTVIHLVFVIYSYYMSICEKSPTEAPTIFFYLTYLYTLALFTVSSRFIIIWISNWIGFFYVIKATISVYKEPFRSKPLHHSRAYSDSSPGRSQMDLDTSAARIRSWQLFYGAIDTTSSQDSKSAQSERDQNSNSRDRDAEDVEMQQARVPSVSGNVDNFYYAYPDVAENINEGNSVCLDELRSQLPWSYTAPAPEDTRRCYSQESIMLENRNKRTCRLKSDSSVSGTEL